jgi:dethiobiotin synthetase
LATLLVTASDTGVGKTRVAGMLARALAARGRVQVVKPVEAGAPGGHPHDAPEAAGDWAEPHTLVSLPFPLAPLAEGQGEVTLALVLDRLAALPPADHRVIEGAGGVGVPLDRSGADWADVAAAVRPDLAVIVVDDRLGAINQARLAHAYLASRAPGVRVGVWLNAVRADPDPALARSNRAGLAGLGIPLVGESRHGASRPERMELP